MGPSSVLRAGQARGMAVSLPSHQQSLRGLEEGGRASAFLPASLLSAWCVYPTSWRTPLPPQDPIQSLAGRTGGVLLLPGPWGTVTQKGTAGASVSWHHLLYTLSVPPEASCWEPHITVEQSSSWPPEYSLPEPSPTASFPQPHSAPS